MRKLIGQTLTKCFYVSLLQEKEERYLMLFPNMLVMLSASSRMSGFIYQVRHNIPWTFPFYKWFFYMYQLNL